MAYAVVLAGYLLYCYNFNVTDFVRPYLIARTGFSIGQTANLSVAANIGITVGAFLWAGFVARVGLRRAAGAIAFAIGVLAAVQALSASYPAWFVARGFLAAALGGYYVMATGVVVALFPVAARGKLIALNSAMYPLSNILLGIVGAQLGDARWHWLLWIGALPLLLAPLLLLVVPTVAPPRDERPHAAGSWREMLRPPYRRLTLTCILLSGIDFNAYQLFASFVTLYLKGTLNLSAAEVGYTAAMIGGGSLVGGFAWAALSDRFGRRCAAVGYLLCAVAVIVFLAVPLSFALRGLVGAAFGVGLACTAAWGVWFAEMFPDHLRPHGAALFHGGHIVALGAPLFVTWSTARFGLTPTMATAAVVYVAGFAAWRSLPETLVRSSSAARVAA